MLSITILFLSVIKPTEITAPLPFPIPSVPIPKVSPTAKFLPPSVRVTALISPLLTVTSVSYTHLTLPTKVTV